MNVFVKSNGLGSLGIVPLIVLAGLTLTDNLINLDRISDFDFTLCQKALGNLDTEAITDNSTIW